MNSCSNCRHMLYSLPDWRTTRCSRRPQNSNLRNFPFKNTKCLEFESRMVVTMNLRGIERLTLNVELSNVATS